ncbi:MAG TPA: response regulator [Candidatus Saccharimonadales bacterium]|jgi:DNA-binding response OmpR family regulator
MKFLLVEDYPSIQEIYKEVFEDRGHKVDVCSDGRVALAMLDANKYDLIALDILLPRVGGVEFLDKLKKQYKPMPKVLVLSDFDKPDLVKKVKSMGVLDYLIKAEYTPGELVELLEKYASGKLPANAGQDS